MLDRERGVGAGSARARKSRRAVFGCGILAFVLLGAASSAWAGPPFLTDDPETLRPQHKEFYLFSTYDKAPDGKEIDAPAVEFNYGVTDNLMFHMVVPYVMFYPDAGPTGRGVGDVELGLKYRFLREAKDTPEVAMFPFVEVPTGNAVRGTGNGQVWYRIPVWAQKSWGRWTTMGGGGYVVNRAPDMRNYWFAGWQVQRELTASFTLGGEVFTQQAATVDGAGSTFVTVGGYYGMDFCGCELLFDGGHTVAGESHAVGYLGLHWEWGPE